MAPALCGSIVGSKRGMLALGWHGVTLLTIVAFVAAVVFAAERGNDGGGNNDYYNNYNYNNNNNNNNNRDDGEELQTELSLTSRAMAFAAVWTGLLALGMDAWGTALLGVLNPCSGTYHSCCAGSVYRTTPLSLGAFVGALVMFANLTLVCAVLFGEFHIRDYTRDDEEERRQQEENGYAQDSAVERSSTAFAIMCLFLTVLYALFAGLVFAFHDDIMEENLADEKEEALRPSNTMEAPGVQLHPHAHGGGLGGGYVGGSRS